MLTLRFFRPFVAVGLVAVLLLGSTLHTAAAQMRQPRTSQTNPVSPPPGVRAVPAPLPSSERQGTADGTTWLGYLLLAGMLYCALGGCVNGVASPQGDSGYIRSGQGSTGETWKPDTSVGCAWGDRAYDTCH